MVAGFFDPLLAGAATRLEEIGADGGAVFVAITDPAEPLLAARARAELVAALRAVNCVVLCEGPLEPLLERLRPDAVFREETNDLGRTRDLMERVWSRRD